MNIMTLLVPTKHVVRIGDEITLYSDDATSPYAVVAQAARCGVRPYELLIHLDPHMRREII